MIMDFRFLFLVIGVGGAGCSAVESMIREGLTGVEYICADTDSEALKNSSAATKLQIPPDSESESKLAELERIRDELRGALVVFVIAGMGGSAGDRGSSHFFLA